MSKKSVWVSAMGVLTGFVTDFIAAFKKRGGTDEQLYELFVGKKSEDFISQIVDLAMKMVTKVFPMVFPIWKTITIGIHDSVKAYRKALTSAGFRISDWAGDILDRIQVSDKQVELDLVKVTVKDLGFTESTSLKQIFAKAKDLGLEPCPAETGPSLRLAYRDQPYAEWVYIAMEPISNSDGSLRVFLVGQGNNVLWLYSYCGDPGGLWGPGGAFVFVLPRK